MHHPKASQIKSTSLCGWYTYFRNKMKIHQCDAWCRLPLILIFTKTSLIIMLPWYKIFVIMTPCSAVCQVIWNLFRLLTAHERIQKLNQSNLFFKGKTTLVETVLLQNWCSSRCVLCPWISEVYVLFFYYFFIKPWWSYTFEYPQSSSHVVNRPCRSSQTWVTCNSFDKCRLFVAFKVFVIWFFSVPVI